MMHYVQHFPRLVVAAPQGRSGKTTLSLGLCAAFREHGLVVQPYKKGPDYIDPSWLAEAAGRPCRSLDPFFLEQPGALSKAFVASAQQAGLNIIEGNHGLFDSFDEAGTGSTAAVARVLQAPVVLVLNVRRTGRSAAAIVLGCQQFEPGTQIVGVVLNQVARGRHERRVRSAIEAHCGIPVLGALPAADELAIPDRHLGLVPRVEGEHLLPVITACRNAAEKYIDLDKLLAIARAAAPLDVPEMAPSQSMPKVDPSLRIGIFRDQAFTFYYPENLEALEALGAELHFINAFEDRALPDLDALYIGGGFPEVFMEQLSANLDLRRSVRQAAEKGLPIYAECGGLMYLSRRITWGNRSSEMAGVLPCQVEVTDKPQGHGYVSARVDTQNPFFTVGMDLRGHEFHNSRLIDLSKDIKWNTAYELTRGTGTGNGRDGLVYKNVLASYMHLHAGGVESWAQGLMDRARIHRASSPAGGA
jgi:cobyrinic acid a,c-diamide synthase